MRHIHGEDNVPADCLSQPNINSIFQHHPSVDFVALACVQESDRDLIELTSSGKSLQFFSAPILSSDKHILGDISQAKFRPLVPKEFRKAVFDTAHLLSHPEVRASLKLIAERFVRPGMKKNIKEFVTCCQACQASSIQRHNPAPL